MNTLLILTMRRTDFTGETTDDEKRPELKCVQECGGECEKLCVRDTKDPGLCKMDCNNFCTRDCSEATAPVQPDHVDEPTIISMDEAVPHSMSPKMDRCQPSDWGAGAGGALTRRASGADGHACVQSRPWTT